MDHLRFIMAAVALFAGTFAGVFWASKNFNAKPALSVSRPSAPAQSMAAVQIAPPPEPQPVAAQPVTAPAVPPVAAKTAPVIEPEPVAMPEPPRRTAAPDPDRLALTAIQAAAAYNRAPCDMAAKAAFVVAASTYLRSKTAGSAADARAHQAIKAAIEAGGIGRDEFPAGTDIVVGAGTRPGVRCINSAGLRP